MINSIACSLLFRSCVIALEKVLLHEYRFLLFYSSGVLRQQKRTRIKTNAFILYEIIGTMKQNHTNYNYIIH